METYRRKLITDLPYWDTSDGRRLYPGDFDDDHLLNTIRYLLKNAERYKKYHDDYIVARPDKVEEFGFRELELMYMRHLDITPQWWLSGTRLYKELRAEAVRRGLLYDLLNFLTSSGYPEPKITIKYKSRINPAWQVAGWLGSLAK